MKIQRVSTAEAFACPYTGRHLKSIAVRKELAFAEDALGVLIACPEKLKAVCIAWGNVTSIEYAMEPPPPPPPEPDPEPDPEPKPKRKRRRPEKAKTAPVERLDYGAAES